MPNIAARIQSNRSELLVRCFDFSPPAGWVRNVDALLTDIAQILRDANAPAGIFSICQIKERFGGLRVHCDGLPKAPSNPSMECEWAAGTEGDTSSTLLPRNWHFEGVCSIDFAENTDDASISRILAAIEAMAYVPDAVAARIRARIHGHVHRADDYSGRLGGCVVRNARGYVDSGYDAVDGLQWNRVVSL
jgi:hypothetical protein